MANLFAWEFGALLIGVIVYILTIHWIWEREGYIFALWAVLSTMIFVWIVISYFTGELRDPTVADKFIATCLMLLGVTHLTVIICWLSTEL